MRSSGSAAEWDPSGFSAYRRLYPNGPDLEPLARADVTEEFVESWHESTPLRLPDFPVCFIFVRGLFGSWIPRHFASALQAFAHAGSHAIIAKTSAIGTIADNARALERDLLERTQPRDRLVFLSHSKGGLDTLASLRNSRDLRDRTAALVLCQTPRAGCAVLESTLLGWHRDSASPGDIARERAANAVLALFAGREGCLDITSPRLDEWIGRVDAEPLPAPLIGVASWSSHPTAWLDSQHARLASIRAGCAHDGLFFTENLIWPGGEQVLIPHLDHSQPGVGGAGFDAARFWLSIARLALRRIGTA
jgi:hypothetical protein